MAHTILDRIHIVLIFSKKVSGNIYIPIVIALYETMVRVALHFPMQNIVSWPGVYIR